MNAQVMYDLLNYIKKDRLSYYDKSMRLLKFMYNDIYGNLSEQITKLQESDNDYSSVVQDFQCGLVDFIDDDSSSILHCFKDMLHDGKTEFIDLFFSKLDTYFLMVDNHLYREDDFIPHTLIFNIYFMLKMYSLYKDDFSKFSASLDEFSSLISCGSLTDDTYSSDDEFYLSEKKQILDKIISIDGFKNIPILKKKFDYYIKNLCVSFGYPEEFETDLECFSFVERVVGDMHILKEEDNDFDEKVVFQLLEDYFDMYSEDDDVFYAPILLYKDRFDYLRDAYSIYLDNTVYMDEVIGILSNFNNRLFSYLDGISNDDRDSFVVCMDIVFDSDSLQEMLNKLNILKGASDLFDSEVVSYDEVLKKIKSLSNLDVKKVLKDGKVVMFSQELLNKIERPDDIYSRMAQVYSALYSVDEDVIKENIIDHYNDSDSIVEFERDVDYSIESMIEEQKKAKEEGLGDVSSELEQYGLERNREINMGYTFSGESVTQNTNTDSTRGIQKSIKKFFGRK